jgi:hypothetical protein
MKKGTITTLALGSALLAAASLVACGGGGGGSAALPSSGSPANPGTTAQSGTHLTVKIDTAAPARKGGAKTRHLSLSKHRMYVSTAANGLQVAVTAGTTQTIYADLSSSSVLCTSNGPIRTCELTIPTVGASESIVATEVDEKPTGESSAGYGTGFPSNSVILAVGTTTATPTLGGVTNLTLGLGPVAGGQFYDCATYWYGPTANFNIDQSNDTGTSRIVVTAGFAQSVVLAPEFCDASGAFLDYDATPLPFVDVNGSPTPITLAASTSSITLQPVPSTPPGLPAFAQTASIPNSGYEWDYCVFMVNANISSGLSAPAPGATPPTIVVANNLTAGATIGVSGPYTQTYTYNVAPVAASTPSGPPLSASTNSTQTLTGSDWGATTTGMDAESGFEGADETCYDSVTPTQVDATVVPSGTFNTTTYQQGFTITAEAAGTCTFYLDDVNTGVVTKPITITVGT